MKGIISYRLVLFFFSSFLIISCRSRPVMINYTAMIPFVEHNSANEERWGYLNGDTGEIMINAKYLRAYPFVGEFAVVTKSRMVNVFINRKGREFYLGRFDYAYLFASSNGKNTVAVLGTNHDRPRFQLGLFGGETGFYKESYSKERMVNLVNRKTIIHNKEQNLSQPDYDGNQIDIIGKYFYVRWPINDLYEFLDNGDIKCIVSYNPARIADILNDYFNNRGIDIDAKARPVNKPVEVDINDHRYFEKLYADPDLSGAFTALTPEFDLPFERSAPLYYQPQKFLNDILAFNERKYIVRFHDPETRGSALGLYNESQARWEILPYITDESLSEPYYVQSSVSLQGQIIQTDNPNLLGITLVTVEAPYRRKRIIYNIAEQKIMPNLELYYDFLHFPASGVYYKGFIQD